MAQLRDLRSVVRRMGLIRFIRKLWFEIGDDNLFTWAAALAYSWLFALFPFFLVLLSLIPMLPYNWRVEARSQINLALAQLPHEAQVTLKQYVDPKLNQVLFEKPRAITWVWTL